MVTGVVVEIIAVIIAVIIAADAYATIPVKIIVITIGIATAAITTITTIIAASIHVPEKEKKLMRPDLEMAVIMPPAGRIIVVANDICKKGRSVWAALSIPCICVCIDRFHDRMVFPQPHVSL